MLLNKNTVIAATILFIEGLVSLSYQMLYIRQIGSNVGNSVDIVSWIIGIFLIALAVGYKTGGEYKGEYENKLSLNLIKASIIALIGLSYIFIEVFFKTVGNIIGYYYSMIVYCLLIVAPATYYLGQTLPLMTNKNIGESVSEISGNILFLSTIGSFLGAILTTNILLKYLGIAYTLLIISCLLISLNFVLNIDTKSKIKSFVCLVFLIGFSCVNIVYEKSNFIKTNQYANYKFEVFTNKQDDNKIIKIFRSNNSYSSLLFKDKELDTDFKTMGYIKSINEFLFGDLKLTNKDILVIGAGGFVLSYGITENRFTFVDIDPQIKDIAEKAFLKKDVNGRFIAMDGRGFVNNTNEKYDVVISDAYSGARSIPESLTTIEYFNKLKDSTKENGWIILNVIQSPKFENEYSKNISATLHHVFGMCLTKVSDFSKEMANVIYLCKNTSNGKVYTDDKVNSNSDYFKATENKVIK